MTSKEDTLNLKDRVVLRQASSDDLPFIYSTWLKNLYHGSSAFRDIPRDIFFNKYKNRVRALLEGPASGATICCLKDSPEVIIGYSVHEGMGQGAALHWIYVKKAWRKMGVGRQLCPPDITHVTHLTNLGKKLKPEEWVYDPFL